MPRLLATPGQRNATVSSLSAPWKTPHSQCEYPSWGRWVVSWHACGRSPSLYGSTSMPSWWIRMISSCWEVMTWCRWWRIYESILDQRRSFVVELREVVSHETIMMYDDDVDDVDDESFSTIQDYSSDESFNHLGKPSLIAEVRMSPSSS